MSAANGLLKLYIMEKKKVQKHALFDETIFPIKKGQQVPYEIESLRIEGRKIVNVEITGRDLGVKLPRTPHLRADTSAASTDNDIDDSGTETETHQAISNGEDVNDVSLYEIDQVNTNHVPAEPRYPRRERRAPEWFTINALTRAKDIYEPS